MNPEAAKNAKTTTKIINQIQQMMIDDDLRAGQKLPSNATLAKRFSTSNETIKQAIATMQQRGLVRKNWLKGIVAENIFQPSLIDPLQNIIKNSEELSADAAEMRFILEVEVTMLAAKRRSLKDLENIETAYQAMALAFAEHDIRAQARTDVQFHYAIAEASHNKIFIQIMRSMMDISIDDVITNAENWMRYPGGLDIINLEHKNIYNAILAGDVKAAEKASRIHISYTQRNL